ncbi:Fe-S oxidoreductase [Lysinibacillus sp. 3P01SB]|uniref:Fe-S oxidoreductase n=1 Tax=Lysinibacillus sp. 3P01SB TaxID=3132284 RepID=UPI0039A65532
MKKYWIFLLIVLLVGCSGREEAAPLFTDDQAVPFQIVKYEEKIAPVYEQLVPHIAYAKTEGQLEALKGRFDIENLSMDMEQYFAVFIVTYSDSCGIAVDGVYNKDGLLSVQLLSASGEACDETPEPHTFVLQVEKGEYEKVQLYNGNVIKSSMDVE